MNEILPNRIASGDDYLNLNVWTPALDGAAPGWPRYSAAERASMRFDTSSQLTVDDRADERALWPRRRSN